MNINQINDAWISAGQKVSDLDAKVTAAAVSDSFDVESFNDLKKQRDNAKAQRDALKEQLDEARANVQIANDDKKQEVKTEKKSETATFGHDFKAMAKGRFQDVVKETNVDPDQSGNGGLLISNDEQTKINELLRQQANLQAIVTTETVNKPKGTRIIDTNEDYVAMPVVQEGEKLPDLDDPKVNRLSYTIKDHGGIFTVTNDELADSDEDVANWLAQKFAKYSGFGRSQAILALFNSAVQTSTISSFDDVKDMEITGIDQELQSGAMFLTNASGYAVLSKVKDGEGHYMIQPDITSPDIKRIDGKQVLVFSDNIVPDVKGSHPLYFGNFKEFATIFDRQALTVDATNLGGGAFETNTTKLRAIDRYDAQIKDAKAVVCGMFKTVADQPVAKPTTDK